MELKTLSISVPPPFPSSHTCCVNPHVRCLHSQTILLEYSKQVSSSESGLGGLPHDLPSVLSRFRGSLLTSSAHTLSWKVTGDFDVESVGDTHERATILIRLVLPWPAGTNVESGKRGERLPIWYLQHKKNNTPERVERA